MNLHGLKQCLTHNRWSINIWHMNEWVIIFDSHITPEIGIIISPKTTCSFNSSLLRLRREPPLCPSGHFFVSFMSLLGAVTLLLFAVGAYLKLLLAVVSVCFVIGVIYFQYLKLNFELLLDTSYLEYLLKNLNCWAWNEVSGNFYFFFIGIFNLLYRQVKREALRFIMGIVGIFCCFLVWKTWCFLVRLSM